MVAFAGLCVVIVTGCGRSEDSWAGGNAGGPAEDETPPDVTPPTGTVTGDFLVWGDAAKDGGNEIHSYYNGMDIRCLVNDSSKTPGAKGSVYYLSADLVAETGALVRNGNTFTAKDFVSPESGKNYKWMGWTISKSANPLVTDNPLTLSAFEGTLRCYWVTVGTAEEAALPPPVETNNTDSAYAGAFVRGDSRDHGPEIYAYVGGMDIRLLANDASKTLGCVADFYNIDGDIVDDASALTWSDKTFRAKNFTSSRSGKKYRWMGWTVESSSNPLVTTNPLTLSSLKKTLRVYWATVE